MSCMAKGCNREMEWDEEYQIAVCNKHGSHEHVMNDCEDCEMCDNPNCENGYVPYGPSYNGISATTICRVCMGHKWLPCDYH